MECVVDGRPFFQQFHTFYRVSGIPVTQKLANSVTVLTSRSILWRGPLPCNSTWLHGAFLKSTLDIDLSKDTKEHDVVYFLNLICYMIKFQRRYST